MSKKDAVMNKIKISDNLFLYNFTNEDAKLPDTITVATDGARALVIDTAYPEYAEKVKLDLSAQGIPVKTIILSHYHSDHVGGCPVFSDSEIYASEFYEQNYNNCRVWEPGLTYLQPQHLLKDGETLVFGDFNLEFLHAPGHSECSIITRLTPRIIHVGDLIMITRESKAALPFIGDGGDFAKHIASLELVRKLNPDILLVPHGGRIDNKEEIEKMIDDRIFYLEKTSATMGTLPLPACLLNDISTYDHLEFHDTNLLRLL